MCAYRWIVGPQYDEAKTSQLLTALSRLGYMAAEGAPYLGLSKPFQVTFINGNSEVLVLVDDPEGLVVAGDQYDVAALRDAFEARTN